MSEKKGPNRYIILGVVILMLVLFPLLSIYMSSSGLQAYKKIKAELKLYADSIRVPEAMLFSQSNQRISTASFKEKVTIAHFYDANCTDCQEIWNELKRIQSEFIVKARRRVQIVTHFVQPDSIQALTEKVKEVDIDTATWLLTTADSSTMSKLIIKGYRMETSKIAYSVALLDINGILVNHYDMRDKAQVNKMMEHIALLIPAKKDRRRIKYEQEKELYK